ncbi:MAG: VCBS repeat-containing protein [Oscillospiraceae bacterium]|nr:VCBS repeat-containing protein [Oscillospiraceae bacterium]
MLKRVLAWLLLLASLVAVLSSCSGTAADDLYKLPRSSEEYNRLQARIDDILRLGAELAPPLSGANRQSLQVKDLDGDGLIEAIAFFKFSGDNPLKIYIFKQENGDYAVADIIEGSGDAVERVIYVDMDGDHSSEIVVGWQMAGTLRHMTLYKSHALKHTKVAESDYTSLTYCDVTGDMFEDVAAIRLRGTDSDAACELFSIENDGEVVHYTANMSADVESIARVITGKLSDGATGIFVDGKRRDGQYITDVFAMTEEGLLKNVPLSATGEAANTERTPVINSIDITGNGRIEVPIAVALPSRSETEYYAIEWYDYDSDGTRERVLTTYHNYSDGWYLVLPESWRGRIAVRREDTVAGERVIVFSYVSGSAPQEDFMRIFTLTGENREERGTIAGRFVLLSEGDTLYAAELSQNLQIPLQITETAVRERFSRLYADWVTGN